MARRDSPGSVKKKLERKCSIFPRFNVARRESPGSDRYGTPAPACRLASMRPGANAGINANSNGLSRRCPDMRASMRPGANRRDQTTMTAWCASRRSCFNEARRESPGSVYRSGDANSTGTRASMRPGANRRDQPSSRCQRTRRSVSFNEARRESPGSAPTGAASFPAISTRFNEARRESPGSVGLQFHRGIDGSLASMRPGANRRDQEMSAACCTPLDGGLQ